MSLRDPGDQMSVESIARVCHEANRGYQAAVPTEGVPVAPAWDDFPPGEQLLVIEGVELAMKGASPRELHESWCEAKRADGWLPGAEKDSVLKTHPCLVDYDELPEDQRRKDALFGAVVAALS